MYTINQSWHRMTWLFEQVAFANKGDAILLIEDGVLTIDSSTTLASFAAKSQAAGIAVFALREDAIARGVGEPINGIELIDVDGFVSLVAEHDKHVAW
nr:sulfurtransferase complex subunit TusB [Arenicella xantha]